MTSIGRPASRLAVASLLVFGTMASLACAEDLSKYRGVQLGTDLPTVGKQIATNPDQAKTIHSRPALIQEMEWSPPSIGAPPDSYTAPKVTFSFYDGLLYRIVVNYDHYQTEGMTNADFVEALSSTYGTAAMSPDAAKAAPVSYGEQEEVVARWEDSQYSFDLIRSSYGPTFRLVGILKKLEGPAQAAILEAIRFDEQEAPQRDAARLASEEETARAKLEKARLVNKLKFQP